MQSIKLKMIFNWKPANVYLLLIITLGAVLRFYKLGYQSFWLDEAHSILLAKYGIYDPSHPPLSFLILRIFLETLGTNEFTARLPSCLFGITTIPIVYMFGKQLFGENEGLVASFIISVSPWYILWSQEARMYTQLTVFTLLALYFFYQATLKKTVVYYVLSAVFTTLSLYTHYSGIFILLILVFWLISMRFFEKKRSDVNYKHLVIFFGLFFIISVPLFFTYIPDAIYMKFGRRGARWGVPSVTYFVFHLFSDNFGPILSVSSILAAILLILKRNKGGILLIFYAVVPLIIFSSLISRMNVALHYVIFSIPAYSLLASNLLIEIVKKLKASEFEKEIHINVLKNAQINQVLAIGFLLGSLLVIQHLPELYLYYSYGEHPDWRTACSFVKSEMNPEDIIVTTASETVEYYLGQVDYIISTEYFDDIKSSQRRVWLLIDDWRIEWIDPDYEIRNWLDSDCERMKEVKLIKVYVFNPN